MASEEKNSNGGYRTGMKAAEATNDYAEKETSLKREKACVKSNFTRTKNKLLLLTGEKDIQSCREIQDACDRFDSCLESVIEVCQSYQICKVKKWIKEER